VEDVSDEVDVEVWTTADRAVEGIDCDLVVLEGNLSRGFASVHERRGYGIEVTARDDIHIASNIFKVWFAIPQEHSHPRGEGAGRWKRQCPDDVLQLLGKFCELRERW